MEGQILIASIVIVLAIIMKVIDSIIDIILVNKIKMIEIANEIDNLKDEVNKLNQQLKPFIKSNDYSIVSKRVDDNWTFLSEEITDIYSAIKNINTEIMYIKDKICS
jgi:50S ribosomal subunit-associated GTPase HflX